MSLVFVKATAITIFQNTTANNINQINQIVTNRTQFQATTSEYIKTSPNTLTDQQSQPSQLRNIKLLPPAKEKQDPVTITNHIIRTNIIVGSDGAGSGGSGGGASEQLSEAAEKVKATTENMRAKLQQLLQRETSFNDDNDGGGIGVGAADEHNKKQFQLQDQQQQQQQLLAAQEQQQQFIQQTHAIQHAMFNGENAYLLERIDGSQGHAEAADSSLGMHEQQQPIYGSWNMKAKRPQAPLLAATGSLTSTTTSATSTSSATALLGEIEPADNFYANHNYQNNHYNHLYERLPRRSSTMSPIRRELHDQIPRPPRLTSRQPSFALRRQFNDTPVPVVFRDEGRPKPFHFPFDGPLPEEFKKQPNYVHSDEVHNIQDILQKLHLAGGAAGLYAPTKMPPVMMMPTGIHFTGSVKNLKSSGLSNFFRGNRNKKQIPLQFPMPIPIHMMGSHQAPMMPFLPHTYQQRIAALDQIYQYKPKSPNDVNLLAMQQQQQQQQQHLMQGKGKNKNKKKKQREKNKALASNNLMLQQYPFMSSTMSPELLYPSLYTSYMTAMNASQMPALAAQYNKRAPFKINLDIFPVLPTAKTGMKSALSAADPGVLSSMRSPSALRYPYADYFTTPLTPLAVSPSALSYFNPYYPKQNIYNPIRFPSGAASNAGILPMAQNTNLQMAYTEQMQKYMQQQRQQQQQQQHRQQQQQQQQQQQHIYANLMNPNGGAGAASVAGGHQTPFLPIDCDQPPSNTQTSPIMVHLNVFPKTKPSPHSPTISTNPFYSNMANINRNAIQEETDSSLNIIEPRHQAKSLNDSASSSTAQISRSDNNHDHEPPPPPPPPPLPSASSNRKQARNLVDLELQPELPEPAALIGQRQTTTTFHDPIANSNYMNMQKSPASDSNGSSGLDQLVADAKSASLFRFPVEDLIQFQVNDAM